MGTLISSEVIAGSFSPAEAFPVVEPFRDEVIAAGLRPAQWVLVSFLVTFGCVRAYTYAVRHGWGPFGNLSVRGVRVHHLVPGIFLLLGSGFLAISIDATLPWWLWWLTPTAFGVGAALTLDEFALWLHFRDVYWAEEGRRSVDACIIAACIGAMVALGLPFWARVIEESTPIFGAAIISWHSLSLVAAAWSLTKGKWVTAAVSIVAWPVGLVGGVRLARPRSLWARRLYGPGKMARAWARFPEDDREVAPATGAADPAPETVR